MNLVPTGATIDQARRLLTSAFRDVGIDMPDLDARVLVAHSLGLDHAALITQGSRILDEGEAFRLTSRGWRRIGGEPVSRVIEKREFWGLPFTVDTSVLDPRPDTETLVELALKLVDRERLRARTLSIADLGVGSGAILCALLSELPNARGVGTDISTGALDVAQENTRSLGLDARADFVASNYSDALRGPFDLIVSNPPYIRSGHIAGLPYEVREFDPLHALDGGIDGLDAYRAIAADAPRLLSRNGHLVVETGVGQQPDVQDLLIKNGLVIVAVKHDLSGIARAIAARISA